MKSVSIDRRAIIFFLFSLSAAVLLVPCPPKFRYVGVTLVIVYFVLGLFSWIDSTSRKRTRSRS